MAKRKAAGNSGSKKPAKRPIEQYAHPDKQRVNNPPVGLVTPSTDPPEAKKKTYAYDPHLDPQLVWAGKAERTSFEVPTVSLHVHERIDPKTIIEAVKANGNGQGTAPRLIQQSLFDQPAENPPLRQAIDFYKHPHGWSNRLIAGDSLLVMNSLLEKEGMAGKGDGSNPVAYLHAGTIHRPKTSQPRDLRRPAPLNQCLTAQLRCSLRQVNRANYCCPEHEATTPVDNHLSIQLRLLLVGSRLVQCDFSSRS
jgi:hypothetical protein